MEYGLIGARLGHSFSPEIHKKIADYRYELCELTPEGVEKLMRERSFRAINVTIPYKETVIPMLDEISTEARRIGAVNTVVNRGGRLYGYNTDYSGAAVLVRRVGMPVKGKKVLILGTGGTSKTLHAVAEDMGAGEIVTVSRTAGEGRVTYAEALAHHTDAGVIVNTTPVGMFPHGDGCPIDPGAFPQLCGVVDVVYNPLSTRLVSAARARGIPAEVFICWRLRQCMPRRFSVIFPPIPPTSTAFTARCLPKSGISCSSACRRAAKARSARA